LVWHAPRSSFRLPPPGDDRHAPSLPARAGGWGSVRQVGQDSPVSEDCVFCRIVSRKVPARVVRFDDATTAFLDMRQPRAGHVLVVPNRHVENIFDLSDDDGSAVM